MKTLITVLCLIGFVSCASIPQPTLQTVIAAGTLLSDIMTVISESDLSKIAIKSAIGHDVYTYSGAKLIQKTGKPVHGFTANSEGKIAEVW